MALLTTADHQEAPARFTAGCTTCVSPARVAAGLCTVVPFVDIVECIAFLRWENVRGGACVQVEHYNDNPNLSTILVISSAEPSALSIVVSGNDACHNLKL